MVYRDIIADFFGRHKVFVLVFSACAVVGVIYGVVYAVNINRLILITDLKSETLRAVVSGGVKGGTLIFENIFTFVIFTGLALAFSVNIYFSVMAYILMLYRGYLIGFNAYILIKLFGLVGAANVFIVFLPQQIILLLVLILASSACSRRCFANHRKGGFINFRGAEYAETFTYLCYIGAIMLVLTLILAIVIPLLSRNFLITM